MSLSIAIISGNAENSIEQCLNSASFADEIIVVAANSTDNTTMIIRNKYPGTKIITTFDSYNQHFSKWRNLAFKAATSTWLFYLDTDEVITPGLRKELVSLSKKSKPQNSYFVVPRLNHFMGHRVRHGGTYPDYVKRFFYMPVFKGFSGILHEEPVVEGSFGFLKHPLLHFTHQTLSGMLKKSIAWTEIEAKALFDSGHPPVVWWRFPRMMLTKLFQRLILQSMWRDGIVGWISAIFESFDTYMIYARLYELQKKC